MLSIKSTKLRSYFTADSFRFVSLALGSMRLIVTAIILILITTYFYLFYQKFSSPFYIELKTEKKPEKQLTNYVKQLPITNPDCEFNVTLFNFNRANSERKQVFFLETSGRSYLTSRQACSVESAAVKSGLTPKVLLKSPVIDLSKSKSFCDLFLSYPNVEFYTVDFHELFKVLVQGRLLGILLAVLK